MSSPALTVLGHLRKLVGFMKQMGDIGVRLQVPFPGQGKFASAGRFDGVLESYADADWSSKQEPRSFNLMWHAQPELSIHVWKQQESEGSEFVIM